MTKFKISTSTYYLKDNGTVVYRDAKTIGYCFINTGNCVVQLNNFVLQPNSVFKTYEPNCVDLTQWRILFNSFSTCSQLNAELTVLIYNIEQ
jgi:hypothetical protein